jgi:hypothetical protein
VTGERTDFQAHRRVFYYCKSLGSFGFGEVAKCVIQRQFEGAEGPEAVGAPQGESGFVVEALDRARGDGAFGPEPVQQQGPVPPQHAGDLLHGGEAGPHRLGAPAIEELARPGGRTVVPEELELFAQEVGADASEVLGQELGQPCS